MAEDKGWKVKKREGVLIVDRYREHIAVFLLWIGFERGTIEDIRFMPGMWDSLTSVQTTPEARLSRA